MRKIQILDGRVHWIFTLAQLPEWNPDHIEVVDYPAEGYQPVEGDLYENGIFKPAMPEPTFEELKAAKVAEINAAFQQAASALTAGYPESERLTWPVQQAEAIAWSLDDTAETPYLDGIAAARDIDPVEMRTKTLAQVQLFMAASQSLVGTRQRLRDAIEAAQSREDLIEINWP